MKKRFNKKLVMANVDDENFGNLLNVGPVKMLMLVVMMR